MVVPSITLNNGNKMPIAGLGTWLSKPEEVRLAVKASLDAGYRLIDTAAVYGNEKDIGDTLSAYFASGKLSRGDVFITTKLWCSNSHPSEVEPAIRESLAKLQTDYVDLYLVHMPVTLSQDMSTPDNSITVEDIWKGMESVYEKGLAKAIGVSNFSAEQIERIQKIAKFPINNLQVELHLHFAQFELQKVCQKYGISLTSYASLGSPGRVNFQPPSGPRMEWPEAPEPMKNPVILRLAKKYKKTPAQILLRQLIQRNIAVIPKSTNEGRIRENFQLFDFALTKEEVEELNKAPQGPRLFLQSHMVGHNEDPFKNER